jgi:hypothetical protein
MAEKRVPRAMSSNPLDSGRYPYRRGIQWPAGMAPLTPILAGAAGVVVT